MSLSDVATLLSGVIRGSGIGSVMFLVYIDDLAKYRSNATVSKPSYLPTMLKCTCIWKLTIQAIVHFYSNHLTLYYSVIRTNNGNCRCLSVSVWYGIVEFNVPLDTV